MFHNPFFWATVVLTVLVTASVIFLIGRKCGRMRLRIQLLVLQTLLGNLAANLNVRQTPAFPFRDSPTETTHLNPIIPPVPPTIGDDAWRSQDLGSAEDGFSDVALDDDEFVFFTNKLALPKRFRFPDVDSGKERFSGITHSEELNPSLPPNKSSLEANSGDEYKAVRDLSHIQIELLNSQAYLVDLQTTLEFLKGQQCGATPFRAQRIKKGK